MAENFFETHLNMVFFLVGAIVGILGGLLSGFCVTAYYRWFDYYNTEITIHPNSFPTSIDFWVFVFSLIAIIGLTYVFYSVIVKFIEKIKNQQNVSSEFSEIAKTDTPIPLIIEKCPICGKIFKGQSEYCDLCGKQLSEPHRFANLFDDNITNLFTILAAIGALISLFPALSNFLIGPDWLNVLLSTKLGFLTLTLLLMASYAGVIFMLIILMSMMREFYVKIFRNEKLSDPEKKVSFVLILISAISFFAAVLYLLFIWIVKFDFAISYNILILFLIGECIVAVVTYYILLSMAEKYIPRFWAIIILLILSVFLCWFVIFPITTNTLTNVSNYYSNKSIKVEINGTIISQDNKIPAILRVNKTLDAYFTKDFSIFDQYYAQCQWSTNYGYFFTITSNNSVIKRQSQEFLLQGCGDPKEIYWTYDIDDYGKNKPLVLIGFNVEDQNKKVNSSLGNAHLIINWTDTDTIKIENDSLLFYK